ncbi:MAG: prolyl oligopeptidase family serine peptidase [Planctomycetes bacterium]|nr:prolyl oligopeptidase family serine peptidase [Planctomycetota bacterium]
MLLTLIATLSRPALQDKPAAPAPIVTTAEQTTLWPLAKLARPKFPDLPAATQVEGVACHAVELAWPRGASKLWIYVPADAKPKATPCVLVAPAGSNLMFGMTLGDGDRAEHLPWAKAGFVVVAYELEGAMPEEDRQTDENVFRQLHRFADSWAGIQDAEAALEYALAKLPMVDPARVFAAGHSSAATATMLFAQHEPRLRGACAFMPIVDVPTRIPDETEATIEAQIPGWSAFLARISPDRHVTDLRVPLFLFGAEDDDNVRYADVAAFAEKVRGSKREVVFEHAAEGGHYQAMIDAGLPRAIAWAQALPPRGAPGKPADAQGKPAKPAKEKSKG